MARRNANGEGSRPRRRPDGRWEGRYCIETPDGHNRRSVYGATITQGNDAIESPAAFESLPLYSWFGHPGLLSFGRFA